MLFFGHFFRVYLLFCYKGMHIVQNNPSMSQKKGGSLWMPSRKASRLPSPHVRRIEGGRLGLCVGLRFPAIGVARGPSGIGCCPGSVVAACLGPPSPQFLGRGTRRGGGAPPLRGNFLGTSSHHKGIFFFYIFLHIFLYIGRTFFP